MFKRLLIGAIVALTAATAFADGILISWGPDTLKGASQETFDQAKKLAPEAILERNKKVTSWPEAYHLLIAANQHKTDKSLLSGLASQIADSHQRRLTDTNRLIIWERITSGEILFEGKGYEVSDDLFTVAGRANWLLRTITGRNLGYVKPGCPPEALTALRDRWLAYLRGETVADVADPFPATEKGLDEIRSMEAVEALIVSLRPSQAKNDITRECLETVYHLTEMPDDPTAQARLCSPDTYTSRYLSIITDVFGTHDAKWWDEWWAASKRSLKWDSAAGKFRVSR